MLRLFIFNSFSKYRHNLSNMSANYSEENHMSTIRYLFKPNWGLTNRILTSCSFFYTPICVKEAACLVITLSIIVSRLIPKRPHNRGWF